VWISGGAYLRCSTVNPHNDGTSLAAGGAVVVSVNYRIGAEGSAHSHGFPDNHGLLDQTGTYFTTELAGDITASIAEEPAASTDTPNASPTSPRRTSCWADGQRRNRSRAAQVRPCQHRRRSDLRRPLA
jgi:hypothetical protein